MTAKSAAEKKNDGGASPGRGGARGEIARLVVTRGLVSKAEIEAALDYSHPTVINTVCSLVADGVLRESGEFGSTGGRKAKAIAANPSYRYFGGIDITRNHVTEVVVDWTGRAVACIITITLGNSVGGILLPLLRKFRNGPAAS